MNTFHLNLVARLLPFQINKNISSELDGMPMGLWGDRPPVPSMSSLPPGQQTPHRGQALLWMPSGPSGVRTGRKARLWNPSKGNLPPQDAGGPVTLPSPKLQAAQGKPKERQRPWHTGQPGVCERPSPGRGRRATGPLQLRSPGLSGACPGGLCGRVHWQQRLPAHEREPEGHPWWAARHAAIWGRI